jgi:hypothetical protein
MQWTIRMRSPVFYDRCSTFMRELLDVLAAAPDQLRPFPEIEDALAWPRRRIASVLGGTCGEIAEGRFELLVGGPGAAQAPRDRVDTRVGRQDDGAVLALFQDLVPARYRAGHVSDAQFIHATKFRTAPLGTPRPPDN